MSRIELAAQVVDDLDRIVQHLLDHESVDVAARAGEIMRAIGVLEQNPRIGRPFRGSLRELVIGRGSRGYVALYRYVPEVDIVFVLAIRGQREVGYAHGLD